MNLNIEDFKNTIVTQIEDLPSLIKKKSNDYFNYEKVLNIFSVEELIKIKRVIFLGISDFYSAAGAALIPFKEYSDIYDVDLPDIVEFTRFYNEFDIKHGHNSDECLVIILSDYNDSDILIEAINKTKKLSCKTMIITNNINSNLSNISDYVYSLEGLETINTPRLQSYVASVLAIISFACYIGKSKDIINDEEIDNIKFKLIEYVDKYFNNYYKDTKTSIFKYSKKFKDIKKFDVIGDGCDFYSGLFIKQKLIECGGFFANNTDSEEWVHVSMVLRNPEEILTIFLITKNSNSTNRICDTCWGSVVLRRPTILVTDLDDDTINDKIINKKVEIREHFYFRQTDGFTIDEYYDQSVMNDLIIFKIPKTDVTWMSTLVNFIPGTLLASYIVSINDKNIKL